MRRVLAGDLNLQDEHGEVSVGEVGYEVFIRLDQTLHSMVAPQPAQSLPGPRVGGLEEETPQGEDVADRKGAVGSPRQAGGEVATLRLVKIGLPAFVRADWPPALRTERAGGAETQQAGLLLLPGREHRGGLGEDELSRGDVSDGCQIPGERSEISWHQLSQSHTAYLPSSSSSTSRNRT